jgi:hypothetical protein
MAFGDHRESYAKFVGFPDSNFSMVVDVVDIETVNLNFASLDAYKIRYQFRIGFGEEGELETFYSWFVPYLGEIKMVDYTSVEELTSFSVLHQGIGLVDEYSDFDNDGLADYLEITLYNTCWHEKDTDKDGLTDEVEVTMGTDPKLLDTDRDGLKDNWEFTHGFDPLWSNNAYEDPDEDGLINFDEQSNGTDPRDDDTDDDGFNDHSEIIANTDPLDDGSNPFYLADFDNDGYIDGLDLADFAECYAIESDRNYCSENNPCECDLNRDAHVNHDDLSGLAAVFGWSNH